MAGSTKYKNKWIAENCDRISLTLPKGTKKEIQSRAKTHGLSVNAYIKNLIDNDAKPYGS